MLVGIVLALIVGFLFFVPQQTEQIGVSSADSTLTAIADHANKVAEVGGGNKFNLKIQVPSNVDSIDVNSNELVMRLGSGSDATEIHKQLKTKVVGFDFSDEDLAPGTYYELTFESFKNGVCIYPPGEREDYCFDISIHLLGLSEDLNDPNPFYFQPDLIIDNDIYIDYIDTPDVIDYYIADDENPCTDLKYNEVSNTACDYSFGDNIIECEIIIPRDFPSKLIDMPLPYYACVNVEEEWHKSVPGYLVVMSACGDGRVEGDEMCDPGAQYPLNLGCTDDDCTCEEGYREGHNQCEAICGDEIVVPPEECDPDFGLGMTWENSFCIEGACICKYGYIPGENGGCVPNCGDGFVVKGEECEDRNQNSNDDCTNECLWAVCGDGYVWYQQSGEEECDHISGDWEAAGCLEGECRCNHEYYVPVEGGCEPICGDQAVVPGEECDPIDGEWEEARCIAGECLCEPGYEPGMRGACDPVCGDRILVDEEECDHGLMGGVSCQSLGYYSGMLECDQECKLDISGCDIVLGDLNCDGAVDEGDIDPFSMAVTDPMRYEVSYPECNILGADINCNEVVGFDDLEPFNKCRPAGICTCSVCGNGIIEEGEECDPEDMSFSMAKCSSSCQCLPLYEPYLRGRCIALQMCGDEKVTGLEECDPDDQEWEQAHCIEGECMCEEGYVSDLSELGECTPVPEYCDYDGITEGLEECDDSNTINGDGCNALCLREYCGDNIITDYDPNGFYDGDGGELPEECEGYTDVIDCKVGLCKCKRDDGWIYLDPGNCLSHGEQGPQDGIRDIRNPDAG